MEKYFDKKETFNDLKSTFYFISFNLKIYDHLNLKLLLKILVILA